jgi:tetratricopeptide (TPR) repeat protein
VPERPSQPNRDRRPNRPERAGGTDRSGRPQRAARPQRSSPPVGAAARPGRRPDPERRADRDEPRRARVAEPAVPDDVSARDLDRTARAELRSLPESLADRIAVHLVVAGRALQDDPKAAHGHAWYARSLAPRLAIVREAAGITAYAIGDYAAALAELRAVRRITGDPSHLPLMADAERGLGRPDRALALGKDPDVKKLDAAGKVELAIVLSGARRDRGEYDAAVVGLQGAALDSQQLRPWTPRLWYAYAEALLAAGRRDEAVRWFESAAAVDDDEETDAAERVAALAAGG